MMSILRSLWRPPLLHHESGQITELILHRLLIMFMLSALMIGMVSIIVDPASISRLLVTIAIFLASFLTFVILQRGHVRLAGYILVVTTWIIIVIGAYARIGVYSPGYILLTLLIVVTGAITDNRTVTVLTVANIGAGLIMTISGRGSHLSDVEGVIFSPPAMWIFMSCVFVVLAIVVISVRQTLTKMLVQIEQDKTFYLSVVNDQTEYIVRWQPDGIRTFVNDAYCRYFGITREQAIGTSFFPHILEADIERIQAKIARLSPTNVIEVEEHRVILPDGTTGWQQWSDRAIYDETGELVGYQSVGRDITAVKELEKKQQELSIATEREEVLRDFLSTMSHDLQTPLAIMRTGLYFIRRLTDPEKLAERADRIDHQIDRLSGMIDDILTVARLEHAPSLNLVTISLPTLLNEVVVPLHDEAKAKHIKLNIKTDTDETLIRADEAELRRALTNLIHNAIKYTPENGTVSVETELNGECVKLQVADTGIGISEDELPHIFDRFYRASNAQGFEKGTGLGLAITRQIIELHDGSIQASSQIGNGTTFIVSLPYIA